MAVQFVQLIGAIAACRQELLEIKRMHHGRFLKSDADRLYPPELDSQQRTATDDIVFALLRERLETCRNLRKILYFIKENQRVVLNKPKVRLNQRNVAQNVLGRIAVPRNCAEFGLQIKVDFYKRSITTFGEMPHALRLTYLPSTFHNQWQSIWARFPFL